MHQSFALVHGLEWCHSHLNTCHFPLVHFLADCQSALILSMALVYPTKVLLGYLKPLLPCSFKLPVDPGHAGLSGNSLADLLTKTRIALPFTHVPSQLAPVIAKIGAPVMLPGDKIFHNYLFCQIPLVSLEELALPTSPAVNCLP